MVTLKVGPEILARILAKISGPTLRFAHVVTRETFASRADGRGREAKRTCLSDDRYIFFNMNGLGPVLGSPYRCVYTCSDRALAYMRHTPHAARGPYYKTTTQAACNEGIRTGRMHRRHAGYGEASTSTQAGVTRRPLRDPSLLAGSTTRFYDTLESLARGHEQPAAVSKLPELQRVRKRSARPKNPPSRS